MARRLMSISKERKFELESQLEILDKLVKVEDFRTKDIQRKYLDKVLRLEIALEEVTLMVEAGGKKREKKVLETITGERQKNIKKVGEELDREEVHIREKNDGKVGVDEALTESGKADHEGKAVSDGSDHQDKNIKATNKSLDGTIYDDLYDDNLDQVHSQDEDESDGDL